MFCVSGSEKNVCVFFVHFVTHGREEKSYINKHITMCCLFKTRHVSVFVSIFDSFFFPDDTEIRAISIKE